MAKRHRHQQVMAAFHYLVKSIPNEKDPENPKEEGFSDAEFQKIINRISDTTPLDDGHDTVIGAIKNGKDLPFNYYEEVETGLYFGDFEGAYYGQKYRNNKVGIIEADSLNLRNFHYLITKLRDGKILVGVTYHGLFGDYDGLRSCLSALLQGNFKVASKTLKSVSGEIGHAQPISIKLTYRKAGDRPERKALFGTSGVIAIKNSDFGADFPERVNAAAGELRGSEAQKKKALAQLVNQGDLLELDEDDIIGCSAVVRENGSQRTIYFLGDNTFSTKFHLSVKLNKDGMAERRLVKAEMIRVMREHIIPLLP